MRDQYNQLNGQATMFILSFIFGFKSIVLQLSFLLDDHRKGITTLGIYQCLIFHAVIETCFEMLKSSENEKS